MRLFTWNYRSKTNLWGFLFSLPAVLLFVVFAAYPILQTFYFSFTEYNIAQPPEYIGLENYQTILTTPIFLDSVGFTFKYAIATYVPTLILALILAVGLNSRISLRGTLRMVNFIPVVISWVIVAVVWKLLFHLQGLINVIIGQVGIPAVNWLLEGENAQWAIIIPSIWKEIGFYMVIFLAGLQNIPGVFYEASMIDGANSWQQFRYVTLPLLRPTIVLSIVVAIITGLKIFIPPFVMTQGGPAGATRVMALTIYQTAFAFNRMGRASAMAVVLFLIILALTFAQTKLYGTSSE
jgi:multiple sugar transport system permease protein